MLLLHNHVSFGASCCSRKGEGGTGGASGPLTDEERKAQEMAAMIKRKEKVHLLLLPLGYPLPWIPSAFLGLDQFSLPCPQIALRSGCSATIPVAIRIDGGIH